MAATLSARLWTWGVRGGGSLAGWVALAKRLARLLAG